MVPGFIGLVPLPGVTVHRWLMLLFLAPLVSDFVGAWRARSAAGDTPEYDEELPGLRPSPLVQGDVPSLYSAA